MRCAPLLLLLSAAAIHAQSGGKAYSTYCVDCHGIQGEGGRGPSLARPRLPRAATDAELEQIIRMGIPNTSMPPTRVYGQELRELLRYVRSLAKTQPVAAAGEPRRGEAIFRGKGNCASCHMVRGEGGRMGPDLTHIGAVRGPAHLRQSIVEPAAELPNHFAQYRLVIPFPDNFLMLELRTRDGKLVRGSRLNEDPFTVQVRGLDDRLHSFDKSEIAELRRLDGESPMTGYRGVLSEEQIDDVVAYLSSLRDAP